MPDKDSKNDPKAAWRSQPVERINMTPQDFEHRANRLRTETRRDMLASAAALLAILLLVWKFKFSLSAWYDVGFAVAVIWTAISVIWFRKRIWPEQPLAGSLSASGADFYRSQIRERRDHLKATWAWLGPAFLALGLFAIRIVNQALHESVPLRNLAPFLALCVIWAAAVVVKRRAKLRKLDEEIRQLDAAR